MVATSGGALTDTERREDESPEHGHQYMAEDPDHQADHGRQRLPLGLHPNGAGPKAQILSRVSVPSILSLSYRLGLVQVDCLGSIPPCTWMIPGVLLSYFCSLVYFVPCYWRLFYHIMSGAGTLGRKTQCIIPSTIVTFEITSAPTLLRMRTVRRVTRLFRLPSHQ